MNSRLPREVSGCFAALCLRQRKSRTMARVSVGHGLCRAEAEKFMCDTRAQPAIQIRSVHRLMRLFRPFQRIMTMWLNYPTATNPAMTFGRYADSKLRRFVDRNR